MPQTSNNIRREKVYLEIFTKCRNWYFLSIIKVVAACLFFIFENAMDIIWSKKKVHCHFKMALLFHERAIWLFFVKSFDCHLYVCKWLQPRLSIFSSFKWYFLWFFFTFSHVIAEKKTPKKSVERQSMDFNALLTAVRPPAKRWKKHSPEKNRKTPQKEPSPSSASGNHDFCIICLKKMPRKPTSANSIKCNTCKRRVHLKWTDTRASFFTCKHCEFDIDDEIDVSHA